MYSPHTNESLENIKEAPLSERASFGIDNKTPSIMVTNDYHYSKSCCPEAIGTQPYA